MANVIMKEKNQLILVKPEANYAVDSSPDGSNAITMQSVNIEAVHDKEQLDRVIGYLGSQGATTVKEYVKLSCAFYLIGSGSAGIAPAWAPFMLAAAHAEVVTANTNVQYTPVDENLSSMSLYWRAGSLEQKVLGARGALSRTYEVNKAPMLSFEGFGIYTAPTAGNADPTGVVTQMMTPTAVRKATVTSMTFFSQDVQMQSLKIMDGNQFEYIELVNHEEVEHNDRRGTLEIKFRCTEDEFVLFLDKSKTNAVGALQMQHGVEGGNIFNENIPQLQMNSVPQLSWENGISYLSVSCDIVPTAKNTDYTLTIL